MSRPSSVDKLPEEIKDEIGRLRANGHTIDEILAALRQLDVNEISRSALARHIQGMEKIGRKLRQSRDVATALVRQFGDEPVSRTAQLNIQLVQSAVLDLFLAEEGEGEGLSPKSIEQLAKALDHLTRSSKADAEYVKQVEDRAAAKAVKDAAARVDVMARERGLSTDMIAAIRTSIIGAPAARPA